MEEIGLNEIFRVLRERRKTILFTLGLFLVVSVILSCFILEPEYQTFTTFIVGVGKPLDGSAKVQYSNVLLNDNLVTTYAQIARSSEVLNEVIIKMNLAVTPEIFRKRVRVIRVENTEIIKIQVSDRDPQSAVKIADEISTIFINRVREIMKMDNVHILDKPELPMKPRKPNLVLNLLIAGILGSSVGIFAAFLSNNLDNRLKQPEEVERLLELPILGMIPKVKKMEQDLEQGIKITDRNYGLTLLGAYRALKANLQSLALDKNLNSLAITGSGWAEGKTTVAVNLAITIAQGGDKVLLIDGDLNKPELHSFLGLAGGSGLAEVLLDNLDYREVVQSTGIKNMDLLTAGSFWLHSPEALDPLVVKKFIQLASEDYDLLIFDLPSADSAESLVLASSADGVILVCALERSVPKEVQYAKQLLEGGNANILGVVLNEVQI